jgi:hypothetical protein
LRDNELKVGKICIRIGPKTARKFWPKTCVRIGLKVGKNLTGFGQKGMKMIGENDDRDKI